VHHEKEGRVHTEWAGERKEHNAKKKLVAEGSCFPQPTRSNEISGIRAVQNSKRWGQRGKKTAEEREDSWKREHLMPHLSWHMPAFHAVKLVVH
jgi:hypothetical protein